MYCGQTAAWIKISLGTGVGISLGHIVLHGNPARHPKQGHSSPPIFGPCLLWPNSLMDQDATWYGGIPRPGHIVLDGHPPLKGHSPHPNFRFMYVVAKALDGSRCHVVER